MKRANPIATALILLFAVAGARAETVRAAVASNFADTAGELGRRFSADSGHEFELVPGSSGKLYAQIVNGAPFDLFLSADVERPAKLEEDGLVVPGSRRTYAIGSLVAWSREPAADGSACLAALQPGVPGKVSIANPELAPYGVAAQEYLEHEGLWDDAQPRLVLGENIAQTLQFAAEGGAVVALVAKAQLEVAGAPRGICSEPVPTDTHAPIEQQVVWLERAAENPAAAALSEYLASAQASELITAAGYQVPAE
jgi:molybdate transport system substrate-binding protein